jgi:hypothetical protein
MEDSPGKQSHLFLRMPCRLQEALKLLIDDVLEVERLAGEIHGERLEQRFYQTALSSRRTHGK